MTCCCLLVKADPSKLYLHENLHIAIFTRSTKCPCGRMMNRCRNCHWHLLMWNKVSKPNEVPLACWRGLTSIGSSVQRHAFNFFDNDVPVSTGLMDKISSMHPFIYQCFSLPLTLDKPPTYRKTQREINNNLHSHLQLQTIWRCQLAKSVTVFSNLSGLWPWVS